MSPFIKAFLIVGLLLGVVTLNAPAIAAVYVYELPDGSKLITDKIMRKKGHSLKRSYNTRPYRSGGGSRPYYARPIKSQYDALIVNMSLKYDLEPAFIKAMIHVESAFDRYALSSAGAMGLMQLMPATAAIYQLNQDQFDPRRNMEAGVRHIKELLGRYDSDKELSLAAYNAGEGAVAKYEGIPPYPETTAYVKKVIRLYHAYKKEI